MISVAISLFLSRLYGGELRNIAGNDYYYFLSRLYGGELSHASFSESLSFLSRLYGGEHYAVSRACADGLELLIKK